MSPLVSVVIPTLNRSDMLLSAIQSVDTQSYGNIEIIIVDDFSDVPVIINHEKFNKKIKIIRNEKRLGGGASRNRGVDASKGEYVCFLDDDDTYYKEKLSFLFRKMNEGVDVVFGFVTVSGKKIKNIFLRNGKEVSSIFSLSGLHTNGSLYKRTVFDSVRFLETLDKYQDTQLHIELILTKSIKVFFYNEPVAKWNKSHGGGQITDLINEEQYLKGLNAFVLIKEYLLEKYPKKISLRILFFKMKVSIFSKLKSKGIDVSSLGFFEEKLISIVSIFLSSK